MGMVKDRERKEMINETNKKNNTPKKPMCCIKETHQEDNLKKMMCLNS